MLHEFQTDQHLPNDEHLLDNPPPEVYDETLPDLESEGITSIHQAITFKNPVVKMDEWNLAQRPLSPSKLYKPRRIETDGLMFDPDDLVNQLFIRRRSITVNPGMHKSTGNLMTVSRAVTSSMYFDDYFTNEAVKKDEEREKDDDVPWLDKVFLDYIPPIPLKIDRLSENSVKPDDMIDVWDLHRIVEKSKDKNVHLEGTIMEVIPDIPKSRPGTSMASVVDSVLKARAKKEPVPVKKFRVSSETIALLAEGIPSEYVSIGDPTFKKPVLSPPYKGSERAKKLGMLLEAQMARTQQVLEEMENEYEKQLIKSGKKLDLQTGSQQFVTTAQYQPSPFFSTSRRPSTTDTGANVEAVLAKMAKLTERADAFEANFERQVKESQRKKTEKAKEERAAKLGGGVSTLSAYDMGATATDLSQASTSMVPTTTDALLGPPTNAPYSSCVLEPEKAIIKTNDKDKEIRVKNILVNLLSGPNGESGTRGSEDSINTTNSQNQNQSVKPPLRSIRHVFKGRRDRDADI
jgi:hypothetical protein